MIPVETVFEESEICVGYVSWWAPSLKSQGKVRQFCSKNLVRKNVRKSQEFLKFKDHHHVIEFFGLQKLNKGHFTSAQNQEIRLK